ncbi:hypothetical protein R3P38DRAFT_3223002 [Favolaschia claudopus]|uniref:Uncharacterized protein n=1 Tax=Favolaschia claudopus TaxID=2862362 RepID=A0AAV9ZY83_9AGAR
MGAAHFLIADLPLQFAPDFVLHRISASERDPVVSHLFVMPGKRDASCIVQGNWTTRNVGAEATPGLRLQCSAYWASSIPETFLFPNTAGNVQRHERVRYPAALVLGHRSPAIVSTTPATLPIASASVFRFIAVDTSSPSALRPSTSPASCNDKLLRIPIPTRLPSHILHLRAHVAALSPPRIHSSILLSWIPQSTWRLG